MIAAVFPHVKQFLVLTLGNLYLTICFVASYLVDKTMLVYRIEDEVGEGMYYSSRTGYAELPSSSKRHPMPYDDSLLVENGLKAGVVSEDEKCHFKLSKKHVFGFVSVEQLRSWLHENKWLLSLHNNGLTLNVYDLPDEDVIVGHTQVIFFRGDGCKVDKHSIAKYFKLPI